MMGTMKKLLLKYFKASGTNANQLANQLKINRSAISHWMSGTSKPAKKYLTELSRITGIPLEDLL
jgi:transcriptional regulator with XRE-family HTH domain